MKKKSIILASKSPRRREILTKAGYEFTVMEADTAENAPEKATPAEAVTEIALQKALYVKEKQSVDKDAIIIAADTMVLKDGQLLGKPRNAEEAYAMLKSLSGNWHTVYTGYTVLYGSQQYTGCEMTDVKFRILTDWEIRDYIKSGEPFDKAGSYGVQGRASAFVERINGDFFNVMGLPVCKISIIVDNIQ